MQLGTPENTSAMDDKTIEIQDVRDDIGKAEQEISKARCNIIATYSLAIRRVLKRLLSILLTKRVTPMKLTSSLYVPENIQH